MLTTDFRHDFVRTFTSGLDAVDVDALRRSFDEMKAQGEEMLAAEGLHRDDRRHWLKLDLRYEGQVHEVELRVLESDLERPGLPEVHRKFHQRHAAIYSYATEQDPVELVNVRLTSVGHTWKVQGRKGDPATTGSPREKGRRHVYFGYRRELVEVPVYDGLTVGPGAMLTGPAIVELRDTNIVVDDHYDLSCDNYGNVRLSARVEGATPARADPQIRQEA